MVLLQVTLCDPYLTTLEAFACRHAIQIHVYFTLLYLLKLQMFRYLFLPPRSTSQSPLQVHNMQHMRLDFFAFIFQRPLLSLLLALPQRFSPIQPSFNVRQMAPFLRDVFVYIWRRSFRHHRNLLVDNTSW